MRQSRLLGAAVLVAIAMASLSAGATPRPLPFTYTSDTLAEGETEIENYVDLTPVKAISASTGNPVWYTATQFQIEFEHGITDKLELGLYLAYQPDPGEAYQDAAVLTEGTGFKERLRYHLTPEECPVGVALYGELVEYTTEFEIEAKVIVDWRYKNLLVAANAWAEREYYYASGPEWVVNPTIGASYQVTPAFHAGVEYWMRAEFPDSAPNPRPFAIGPNQFVGPALMFNFGHLWWSTGIYARVNDVNRTAQPGDDYGPMWARTVVGIEL